MKKKGKGKKKFEFPNSLLNQIEECSAGGFVLFTYDEEGLPQVHSAFDNMQNALGMQYYISNWSKAVDTINMEATINSMSIDEMEELPPEEDEM